MTRAEISDLYGGSKFGGIEPSKSTPNVLVYSDPIEAEKHGYTFDGWSEDGDVYLYTGEGAGRQEFTGGNRSIRDHVEAGRTLRLFRTTGRKLKPGGKVHYYVGAFELDKDRPYVRADCPDKTKKMRSAIVFRLKPLGRVERRDGDKAATDDISPTAECSVVPVERANVKKFDVSPRERGSAQRREADLTSRYQAWLEAQQHAVGRLCLRPPGDLRPLYTDIYDITDGELYEAKGAAERDDIRMAVGQLLDYRRHIDVRLQQMTILLPERPSDDLVDFITSCGMGCVYATASGAFDRVDVVPNLILCRPLDQVANKGKLPDSSASR
ncbi:restriction endonuclease [Kibdelosporangium persicum]|uniref:5-methylcytosine-specific restriction enzyme A n=1 Tax=Kibdelosporangium persicum TaxID=2698649 RepID=A0ABX2FC29_9PSEU|nr:restriction endonuclease [Kibdelosporangium persicum]NRN68842.1 5-methylcytosine-specific restriction enzyme A [Kibdelosporangium persicum]